ncbi:hypothetical protein [Plasmodium yoelii yoelii]|uniref:Uncharacterized protein n=1 Tax=Plasmodium yoelii yoelii TaxID=73239 RepID=Q7R6Z4_PLAYO|nr:hypothetical protein [Plasmodium yoelii yoelii]
MLDDDAFHSPPGLDDRFAAAVLASGPRRSGPESARVFILALEISRVRQAANLNAQYKESIGEVPGGVARRAPVCRGLGRGDGVVHDDPRPGGHRAHGGRAPLRRSGAGCHHQTFRTFPACRRCLGYAPGKPGLCVFHRPGLCRLASFGAGAGDLHARQGKSMAPCAAGRRQGGSHLGQVLADAARAVWTGGRQCRATGAVPAAALAAFSSEPVLLPYPPHLSGHRLSFRGRVQRLPLGPAAGCAEVGALCRTLRICGLRRIPSYRCQDRSLCADQPRPEAGLRSSGALRASALEGAAAEGSDPLLRADIAGAALHALPGYLPGQRFVELPGDLRARSAPSRSRTQPRRCRSLALGGRSRRVALCGRAFQRLGHGFRGAGTGRTAGIGRGGEACAEPGSRFSRPGTDDRGIGRLPRKLGATPALGGWCFSDGRHAGR